MRNLFIKNFTLINPKGFTLIELLIVIAILGIIIAAVVAGIDPVDKINAANDAKVQANIGAIGTAFEANAAQNGGSYAASIANLVTSGDLKSALVPPSGYGASYTVGAGGATQYASGVLKSKKYTAASPATGFWIWCSSNGKVCATTTATTCCP